MLIFLLNKIYFQIFSVINIFKRLINNPLVPQFLTTRSNLFSVCSQTLSPAALLPPSLAALGLIGPSRMDNICRA
jgi:hypothetical protein